MLAAAKLRTFEFWYGEKRARDRGIPFDPYESLDGVFDEFVVVEHDGNLFLCGEALLLSEREVDIIKQNIGKFGEELCFELAYNTHFLAISDVDSSGVCEVAEYINADMPSGWKVSWNCLVNKHLPPYFPARKRARTTPTRSTTGTTPRSTSPEIEARRSVQ
jgi:hypothetical protein